MSEPADIESALSVSAVIPTLDEARSITETLDAVARVGGLCEIVVVDGGSADGTREIARAHACGARVIESERGRGAQMHAGASVARGRVLWFLHADTRPPADGVRAITDALADAAAVGGNFGVSFDGDSRPARFMTWLYPKLRALGLAYGDSAFFVRREAYERAGGFRPFPVFEDLDLAGRLRRQGRFVRARGRVVTSSRRFEGRNFLLTFARWAGLQLLYWLGVHPRTLAGFYAPVRSARARRRREQTG
ncbi:MAG: TIGR04283 family arsenosugar biosynthesis glycosyltransferase [Acidobacteria bacterium]|nr:TIGR04283 family arsenosugar biosynthesis glycosyltransferase [Acidobacteriota bacterium]